MDTEVAAPIEKSTYNDSHEEGNEILHQSASLEQSVVNAETKLQPPNTTGDFNEIESAEPTPNPEPTPAPAPKIVRTHARQTPPTPPQNDIEEANDAIAQLLLDNRISVFESSKLQAILRENAILKEKVAKLKTLLARSSKASKETKIENLEYKRLLDVAKKEVERLNGRVEALASRPTHMDLLADFETNFDRALMNLHTDEAPSAEMVRQSVGQATEQNNDEENVSSMLMAELNQTKARVEHLESMNSSLKKRSIQLEKQNEELMKERESGKFKLSTSNQTTGQILKTCCSLCKNFLTSPVTLKMSNLQLELKMARMETDNASRAMREKTANLTEMQMEIDLVTRSAMDANARAAQGMEVAESAKTDKAQVEELKAKVAALQEWAIASSEAKEAVIEENKVLGRKLREYERQANEKENNPGEAASPNGKTKIAERHLWTKTSSVVVGAGTLSSRLFELGENKVMDFETVILRWKFDITPSDQDIHFSILKGKIDTKKYREADGVIKDRTVVGGGGGEVQGAFAVQNACTVVWSNEHSWVRPRAIKFSIQAFAVR